MKKEALQLTQQKVAAQCKFSQPTFNQYLNGVIPLNTDVIFTLANVLKVSPADIDPRLQTIGALFEAVPFTPETRYLRVLGTTTGDRIMHATTPIQMDADRKKKPGLQKTLAAVQVTDDSYLELQGLENGSRILLDLDKDPLKNNSRVVIRLRNENHFTLFLVKRVGKTSLRAVDQRFGTEATIPLDTILDIHSVCGTASPE